MRKKIYGVIFSYIFIVIDIVVGILFVPFLLKGLGENEYGLYKLLLSTASYLSILDFGIGGTMTRYIVKYKTEKNKQKEENFIAIGLIVYSVLSVAVMILGLIICCLLPTIYSKSISQDKMSYAQVVFIIMFLKTSLSLFNHAYDGILSAYEEFTFLKLSKIIEILIRVSLIVLGVLMSPLALIIVIVDLCLAIVLLFVNIMYSKFKTKIKIKLYEWDKPLVKEALIFTSAILGQGIITQFNSNLDNVILGIFSTTAVIAMYSIVLQLFTMYSCLATTVTTIYMPTISESVFNGDSDEEVTRKVITPSRIQLIILLLALTGFYLYGQEFIILWVGEGYEMVYMLSCILLTAATLQLSQNSINSVLKAKNIFHGYVYIIGISTLVNLVITLLLVPKLGPLGAVIGTSVSMLLGYGIALNVYFHCKAKINLKIYFLGTLKGILPSAIISLIIGMGISLLIPKGTIILFILRVITYLIIYIILMCILGFNKQEKLLLGKFCRKVFKIKQA